jgi:hypothetical protein
MMDDLKYDLLIEVLGSMEAELVKSYLESQDISVKLFEESLTHTLYPNMFGRVQVFVEKENIELARKLLEEYESATGTEE